MASSLRRGRNERAAGKRHFRASIWTNYGPAAGQTLKLGRKHMARYNAMLHGFSLANGAKTAVTEVESREAACAGAAP